jgi:RNA polymerase sigma-32 factor
MVDAITLEDKRKMAGIALRALSPRDQHVLIDRRLKEKSATLQDLANQYNVSRERIRQIEERAFQKFTKMLQMVLSVQGQEEVF